MGIYAEYLRERYRPKNLYDFLGDANVTEGEGSGARPFTKTSATSDASLWAQHAAFRGREAMHQKYISAAWKKLDIPLPRDPEHRKKALAELAARCKTITDELKQDLRAALIEEKKQSGMSDEEIAGIKDQIEAKVNNAAASYIFRLNPRDLVLDGDPRLYSLLTIIGQHGHKEDGVAQIEEALASKINTPDGARIFLQRGVDDNTHLDYVIAFPQPLPDGKRTVYDLLRAYQSDGKNIFTNVNPGIATLYDDALKENQHKIQAMADAFKMPLPADEVKRAEIISNIAKLYKSMAMEIEDKMIQLLNNEKYDGKIRSAVLSYKDIQEMAHIAANMYLRNAINSMPALDNQPGKKLLLQTMVRCYNNPEPATAFKIAYDSNKSDLKKQIKMTEMEIRIQTRSISNATAVLKTMRRDGSNNATILRQEAKIQSKTDDLTNKQQRLASSKEQLALLRSILPGTLQRMKNGVLGLFGGKKAEPLSAANEPVTTHKLK